MFSVVEYAGVAKVIQITSYIPGDTFTPDTPQYKFFERELKYTSRKRTPWCVRVIGSAGVLCVCVPGLCVCRVQHLNSPPACKLQCTDFVCL
jgi:hypothetical protein